MTREELIQFMKANDPHYSNFTFQGHSRSDLHCIKQKIEEEKRKESQPNSMFSKLFR